ncbi:MAG: 30S ribosomal protein S19e [Candidatus Bathyarchaeota archaeon]
MPTVYDVPADDLIKRTADYLRENITEVSPPLWAALAKSSSHLVGPPQSPDYWYIRSASLLRKIYVEKLVGVGHLRKEYGGRTSRGTIGKHKRRGGGAVIRNILKQLENAGLVKTVDKKGRRITEKGASTLDTLAGEVLKGLVKEAPELKKYE